MMVQMEILGPETCFGGDFNLGHGKFDRHISRQVEQNGTHLGKSFNLCAYFPPLTMLTPVVPTSKTFGKIT